MFKLINKLFKAYKNSWNGLKFAFHTQWTIRLELFFLLIGIPSAIYLSRNISEFLLLVGSLIFILIIELINTAIETVVNRIGLEQHALSGLAKDLASASVFFSCLYAILIWLVMLLHTLFAFK